MSLTGKSDCAARIAVARVTKSDTNGTNLSKLKPNDCSKTEL